MSASSTVTLAQLRTAAQSRADMIGSNFVSASEWLQFINNSYKELYDLLVQAYGEDYFASVSTLSTDGVNTRFSLPSDFYKLLGVDLQVSNRYQSLKTFTFRERNSSGLVNPIPPAGQTIQVFYIPEPTNLVSDSDTIDGISGWEEYIIVDAAIKALSKEESDVSLLESTKLALKERLLEMAINRDTGSPARVVDVYERRSSAPMRYRIFGNQIWLLPQAVPSIDFDPDLGEGWSY